VIAQCDCEITDHKNYNIMELEIICRIGASRIISLNQLIQFLILQGYEVCRNKVKNIIQELWKRGIISKIYIENQFVDKLNSKYNKMICYRLRSKGLEIAKILGVQVFTPAQQYLISEKYNIKQMTRYSIVCNQIVINQLLLNNKIKSFEIFGFKNYKNIHNIELPLSIDTRKGHYVFEFVNKDNISIKKLEKIIQSWRDATNNSKDKIILVLMFIRAENSERFSELIASENSDNLTICYSDIDKWFNSKVGCIFTWIKFMGQLVNICIDDL